MEHLREIYEAILEYKPTLDRTLTLSGFRDALFSRIEKAIVRARECQATGININDDPVINEILYGEDKQEDKTNQLSREERLLLHTQKVRELNIDDGVIVPCNDYIYTYGLGDYYNLTFEQFCSYIYWRTQVRCKQNGETPIPYLYLYLLELCNFIEFSTVTETYQMLLYLAETVTEKKAKSIVYDTLSDFLVYYGTVDDVKPYDTGTLGFQYVKECLQFINGTHPAPFDFIVTKAEHKIKKSTFYQDNPTGIETQFMQFFSKVLQLLKDNGVDLIPLWVGKYALIPINHVSVIKNVKYDLIMEKQFIEDGIVLRRVSKDGVVEASMTSLGEEVDPGQCIFHTKCIIDYPIKAFENELRKNFRKRQLKVSTEKMREMLEHGEKPLLRKIVEVYESEAFFNCVKECVLPLL